MKYPDAVPHSSNGLTGGWACAMGLVKHFAATDWQLRSSHSGQVGAEIGVVMTSYVRCGLISKVSQFHSVDVGRDLTQMAGAAEPSSGPGRKVRCGMAFRTSE